MNSLVPDAQLKGMPLHAITEVYGTSGLLQRFDYETANRFGSEEQLLIRHASLVARALHSEDQRVREPYANHLLRVASRMMVHYAITDPDVISAGLLHDSVEDHAAELSPAYTKEPVREALQTLATWFNPAVSSLVKGVTNPEFDPKSDKNEQYLAHLSQITAYEDPRPLVIKLSDFTDNATGIMYTSGPKVLRLATKYLPAIPIFKESLERSDLPLEREVIIHIRQQLDLTEAHLGAITSSTSSIDT